jgi:4'-phosphopantetheinyl transferase
MLGHRMQEPGAQRRAACGRAALERPEVHVWLTRPECIGDPPVLSRYRAMLTEDELERCTRMRFERHRHERLVARALVRTTLSRYADVAPAAWRFALGAHGRPEIDQPALARDLRFNLSHTDGLIACAVGVRLDVGCDVEHIGRRTEVEPLASRYFSMQEASDLAAVPTARRRERFFQYWTLKEAYIKACGMGLRIPLGSFSLTIDGAPIDVPSPDGAPAAQTASIAFHDIAPHTGYARPDAWQLGTTRVGGEHMLAWGIHRPLQAEIPVRVRECVP